MKLTSVSSRLAPVFRLRAERKIAAAIGMTMMLSLSAMAQTAANSTYEPSSRQRLRAESCMKDEVTHGAACVKRCDEGFRLDASGVKAICRAEKSGATRKTPKAEYQPPPAANTPPAKEGY